MESNEALLIIRQTIIKIYKRHEYIFFPLIKFVVGIICIQMLTSSIGYSGHFNKMPITLLLVLLATFLPEKWIALSSVFVIPLYFIAFNPILALIFFAFLWILYLAFMRLFPRESLLIIITLVCFKLGVEIFVPITAALFGGYVGVIAIILGVFIWFVMPEVALTLQASGGEKSEVTAALTGLMTTGLKSILTNPTMLCSIVVFFIVFSIVHIIRKQPIDYAPYIAIGIGAVMNIAGFGLAALFLGINTGMVYTLVMTIIAVIVAGIFQFFSKVLDYQRSEMVSFEDEDNYYYVKVIPKIQVNTTHNKTKTVYNAKTEEQGSFYDLLNGSGSRSGSTSVDE